MTTTPAGYGLAPHLRHIREVQVEVCSAVFRSDPRVRAVGIGLVGGRPGFHAQLGSPRPVAPGRRLALDELQSFPMCRIELARDPRLETLAPEAPDASTGTAVAPALAERGRMRPLLCGAEIENVDCFNRRSSRPPSLPGMLQARSPPVGTLGCFVVDGRSRQAGLLSCAHVLNPVRSAWAGDRVIQPGSLQSAVAGLEVVADFVRAVPLVESPAELPAHHPHVAWNEFDIALASLDHPRIAFRQRFDPAHGVPDPAGTDDAALGDVVFKIGRGSGLTRGKVVEIDTQLAVTPEAGGTARLLWFAGAFVIEPLDGAVFSSAGDSGAVVVRASDGLMLGMLFAGAGNRAYAFPLAEALGALDCDLARLA